MVSFAGDPIPKTWATENACVGAKGARRGPARMKNSKFIEIQALVRQLSLAIEEAPKKWIFRHREWVMICSLLMIHFGDRLTERL